MSWSGSNTRGILFFFHSSSRSLRFPRNICILGLPFLHFGDRCKSKGFLLDARQRKESRLCATVPFSKFLSIYNSSVYDASVSPDNVSAISFPNSSVNPISESLCLCRRRILWDRVLKDICEDHKRNIVRCKNEIYIYIYM